MAALQKDLLLARIQPGSFISDFWLLRARGYSDPDLSIMSESAKAAAVSGNPFMSPRFSMDSQDVFFLSSLDASTVSCLFNACSYLGCKHTGMRLFFCSGPFFLGRTSYS